MTCFRRWNEPSQLPVGRVALFLGVLTYEVERSGLIFVVIGGDDQQTGAFVTFLLLKGAKSGLAHVRATALLLPTVFPHARRDVEALDVARRLTVRHEERHVPMAGLSSI